MIPFQKKAPTAQAEVDELVSATYADPLAFVQIAYPWGQPGTFLEHHTGPDIWQQQFLEALGAEVRRRNFDGANPVEPIRMAVSKGHGVGGSVVAAWVIDWIQSTRPNCKGTVTANTAIQLETKTWATLQRWRKLNQLTKHWFLINSQRLYEPKYKDSWFFSGQTCKEENSEAFAGQHAADSTSAYVFDEASAIPDTIFEVAEGGLTDGEPMIFLFGNPTRNTGKFFEACFGKSRDRWISIQVDSRESRFTNKGEIARWAEEWGEDSDFFRVRVRGLAPNTDESQFIDLARIRSAQKRPLLPVAPLSDEPLIAGVDVSGGGKAWTVCRFRRGLDARSIPPLKWNGEKSQNRDLLIAGLAEALREQSRERHIAAMFIDSAFGSPIVERLRVLGFTQVHEVNFGADSPDPHQANQRAYQWNRMKDWLLKGAISDDVTLESDLVGPGFHHNKRSQLVLESKESMAARGLDSPDHGDALSLTFAQAVGLMTNRSGVRPYKPSSPWL